MQGTSNSVLKNAVLWDVTPCGYWTDISEEHSASINLRLTLFLLHRSCHPDDDGSVIRQNVGSYESHMA
jgi:hypothetical protein